MKIEKVRLGPNAYYPNTDAWKISERIDGEEWGLLCLMRMEIPLAIKAILDTKNLTPEERNKL